MIYPTTGVRMKILGKRLVIKMKDGGKRRFMRGDIVPLDEVDEGHVLLANHVYGPRDGTKALAKLIEEARHEGRDSRGRWIGIEEPGWYKAQIIPIWTPVD